MKGTDAESNSLYLGHQLPHILILTPASKYKLLPLLSWVFLSINFVEKAWKRLEVTDQMNRIYSRCSHLQSWRLLYFMPTDAWLPGVSPVSSIERLDKTEAFVSTYYDVLIASVLFVAMNIKHRQDDILLV